MIAAGLIEHHPLIWQQSLCKLPIKFLPSHQLNLKLAKMIFPPSSVTFIHSVSDGMLKEKDKLLWRSSLNIILTVFSLFSGIHLKICPRGVTCCTPEMETKLWTLSRDSFNQALAATTAHLQASFNAKSRKFDGEFCPSFPKIWAETGVFLASFRLWDSLMDLLPCNYTIWHKNYNIKLP